MPKDLISLEDAKDKILGKIGTERRDRYELELSQELNDSLGFCSIHADCKFREYQTYRCLYKLRCNVRVHQMLEII